MPNAGSRGNRRLSAERSAARACFGRLLPLAAGRLPFWQERSRIAHSCRGPEAARRRRQSRRVTGLPRLVVRRLAFSRRVVRRHSVDVRWYTITSYGPRNGNRPPVKMGNRGASSGDAAEAPDCGFAAAPRQLPKPPPAGNGRSRSLAGSAAIRVPKEQLLYAVVSMCQLMPIHLPAISGPWTAKPVPGRSRRVAAL